MNLPSESTINFIFLGHTLFAKACDLLHLIISLYNKDGLENISIHRIAKNFDMYNFLYIFIK
jgi:hypothetical protein